MVGWFTAARPHNGPGPLRRTRPSLEQLEARDCPAAPVISSFSLINMGAQSYRISGTVQDEHPANCVVIIDGAVKAEVPVNADGTFAMNKVPYESGALTAIALDDEGLTSAEAFAQVLNEPPKITSFIGSHGYGNTWTFSGTLEDESPTTCVVQLTGLPGLEPRQLSVAADGTFSVTVQLPADFTWVAIAQATDSLGQVSDAATFAST